ncbi:uncharacterized protein BXZ73DRAFT_108317 [Epithele typhae]|uniref:uncharacterized protein n=1 Tax=Epithele typhae TaxID=378194 RepID=UPI0020082FE6|nr:uncharacterized protein BXZ73DRAFT_108317 [Epithele typhae]KAH9910996.1 hypothetical protein BXZ73DRAFT_108317 [Epithele typhae]
MEARDELREVGVGERAPRVLELDHTFRPGAMLSPLSGSSLSHQVFFNADLLPEIFHHLSPYPEGLDNILTEGHASDNEGQADLKCTLAACARVSRAFSDVALDALWRTLNGLWPLWCIMPDEDALSTVQVPEDESTAEAGSPSWHWFRFRRYAFRVRELRCKMEPFVPSMRPDNTADLLIPLLSGAPLLPRLEHLDARFEVPDWLPLLSILLSPSLRSIRLSLEYSRWGASQLRTTLIHSLLRLMTYPDDRKHERRLIPWPREFHGPSLEHLLAQDAFHDLHTIDTLVHGRPIDLDRPTVEVLSRMPSLKTLFVALALGVPPACHDGFVALETLHVSATPADIAHLFAGCRFPRLRALALRSPSAHLPTALAAVPRSVTALALELRDSWEPVRLAELLAPLLARVALTSFTLDLARRQWVSVTDGDLDAVAGAWPALVRLEITLDGKRSAVKGAPPADAGVACPTVGGAVQFASRCPALRALHLPMLRKV